MKTQFYFSEHGSEMCYQIEKLESLSNPLMDLFMDFETLKNNIKKTRKL